MAHRRHHSTDLVLDALVMAVTYRARQGVKVAGLIHHSDYAEDGVKPRNLRTGLFRRCVLTGSPA